MDIEAIAETANRLLVWVPDWAISLVILAAAVTLALVLHRTVFRLLTRVVRGHGVFGPLFVERMEGPTRLALVILALSAAATIAPLSDREAEVIRHVLLLCFIALAAWVAQSALHLWMAIYLRRFDLHAEDNLLARKHVTQTRIMRRVADTLIVIVTIAAALMTFEGVRQYGVSLLASAGAAGLVVGLALQPVLKNLFAGIQLAMTQPIRIDDALLVEGEWGKVEEITSTYVVVRVWDWRRLILPLSYFIEQPFQNWTREGAALIGNVMIYLDYAVPVSAVREKVEEIAAASPLWDRQVLAVQVTDFREQTMEIRILVSAGDAGRAFDLRCEIREKLVSFLQSDYPEALPRLRTEISAVPERLAKRVLGREQFN
ncbi:MAG: hypothetical protein BroJett029_24940 [Alphaproteobacteria bacterium]|nr:MAG: hypothetical protein BroJett029_24940 [Alphaproteobacteria bacterium]